MPGINRQLNDDIVNIKADIIVNAANSIGYMGGFIGKYIRLKGVAESIHYVTRGKVEKEAKKISRKLKPKPGDVYVTSAYNLQAKWIFHAVTMRLPGTWSNVKAVEKCLEKIVNKGRELNVETIALTGLGTGTGRLSKKDVANLYKKILSPVNDLEIIVVDRSEEFLKLLKELE